MKLLKVINPEGVDKSSIGDWHERHTARAVVFDKEGNLGLLYIETLDYHKLPGGGVEAGEDMIAALHRECKEELGVEVEITGEVGTIEEWRKEEKLLQTSNCYVVKVTSEKGRVNFTDEEKAAGFEVLWVAPKEALKLLSSRNTKDYEDKFIETRDYTFLETAL